MSLSSEVSCRETYMGKLKCGSDLLEELTHFCTERNITLGRVEAIGAVQTANLGFYDQETKTYGFEALDSEMEITNLTGNISLKDGKPFVHAHVTLVDGAGKFFGGHLASGTKVFACEFVLQAFDGPSLERELDEETGLPLWRMAE
jgi:predicted DNA-binding protein with PD1-like motif